MLRDRVTKSCFLLGPAFVLLMGGAGCPEAPEDDPPPKENTRPEAPQVKADAGSGTAPPGNAALDSGPGPVPLEPDAGPASLIDAGLDDEAPVSDAGGAEPQPESDGGAPSPVRDAGPPTDSPPPDGGTSHDGALSTEQVYLGLNHVCFSCHQQSYFETLESFRVDIVENSDWIVAGNSSASRLLDLLQGNASGTESGYSAMPPFGDNYAAMDHSALNGDPNPPPSLEALARWIDETLPNEATSNDPPDAGGGSDGETLIDLENSHINVQPNGPILADGKAFARIHITVLDPSGAPLPGAEVTLESDRNDGLLLTQPSESTNAAGRTSGYAKSINGGDYELTARVTHEGQTVALNNTATLEFDDCLSTPDLYREFVYGPTLSICIGCHNEYGLASETGPLSNGEQPLWQLKWGLDNATIDHNLDVLRSDITDGPDWLLVWPLSEYHGGGNELIQKDDAAYQYFELFVDRLNEDNDPICSEGATDLFEGVAFMTPEKHFERAILSLYGRPPNAGELDALAQTNSVEAALTDVLQDPPQSFFNRLEEVYNDALLTDFDRGGAKPVSFLSSADYPRQYYFWGTDVYNSATNQWSCEYGTEGEVCCTDFDAPGEDGHVDKTCKNRIGGDQSFCEYGSTNIRASLRREALALLAYVVKNDLPLTEILTADYTVVNPLTARIYHEPTHNDLSELIDAFEDDCNLDDWKLVRLNTKATQNPGLTHQFPHAGVFSTRSYLTRYSDTPTNLSRLRSKTLYKKFLDIDIDHLFRFKVGQGVEALTNPTLDGFSCRVCHAAMDPVGYAFHKRTPNGAFRIGNSRAVCGEDGANAALCVRPPGYKGMAMPPADQDAPLQWLVHQMAADTNHPFAKATARTLFHGYLGLDPVEAPADAEAPNYHQRLNAYLAQENEVQRVADVLVASNHNAKQAIVALLSGPYAAAQTISPTPNEGSPRENELLLGQIGGGKMFTPTQLNRRIQATVGLKWYANAQISRDKPALLDLRKGYQLLYGGIDSGSITARERVPSPVTAAVASRMANEVACFAVAQDFTWADALDRHLFQFVEIDTVPKDEDGNPIEANMAAIEANIEHLHAFILGEDISNNLEERTATKELFLEAWDAYNETGSDALNSKCQALYDLDVSEGLKFYPDDGSGPRNKIDSDPNHTIRSWMAVVSYLLSDLYFLME